MSIKPSLALVALALACLIASSRTAFASSKVELTVSDVIAGIESYQNSIFDAESFLIEYERGISIDHEETAKARGYAPARWLLAYKGDKWYGSRVFTMPTPGFETPEGFSPDPLVTITSGESTLEWNEENSNALFEKYTNAGNIYLCTRYFRNMSLNIGRRVLETRGSAASWNKVSKRYRKLLDHPFLPEFLRKNASKYSVSKSASKVNGHECWKVEWPGMDTFTVVPGLGYAIAERKYNWREDGPARMSVKQTAFAEISQGVWMPNKQQVDMYAHVEYDNKEIIGKVVTSSTFTLQRAEFNSLDDDFFTAKLPDGTYVDDFVRGLRYVVSSNEQEDPFKMPVVEALSKVDKQVPWLFWINVVAVVFLFLVVIGRRYISMRRGS